MPPETLSVGDRAPQFRLPDTDGVERGIGDPDNAAAAVVVFTCNHCPYALGWHERIVRAAQDYGPRGVRFLAINPNDAERYPADSYEAMQRRVAEEEWPMPYLHDADQEVARAYGARTTPDLFVLDAGGRVVYRGAPDADHSEPSLDAAWLREALDDTLAGRDVRRPETEPVGCSVKWKR
jgi:peroxiredoxin